MSVFLLTRSLQRADHGLLTDIAEGGLPEVIGSLSVAGDKSQFHLLTPLSSSKQEPNSREKSNGNDQECDAFYHLLFRLIRIG